MANTMWYKKALLCRASNRVFEIMYELLEKIYKEKQMNITSIKSLIEALDQETYGYGCVSKDLEEYFKTKSDYLTFAEMINDVIQKIPPKYGLAKDDPAIIRISELYTNLLKLIDSMKS